MFRTIIVNNSGDAMKKRIFIIFQFIITTTAFALDSTMVVSGGIARTLALGGSPTNPFLLDQTDVLINPAFLKEYSNSIFLELGNDFNNGSAYRANNQSFGASFNIGSLTLGCIIGMREGPMFAENSIGYQSGGSFLACDYMKAALDSYLQSLSVWQTTEPTIPFQIIGAMKFSNATAGISLYFSHWGRNDQGAGSVSAEKTCSVSLEQYGIKGGVLLPLSHKITGDFSGCLRLNRATADYHNTMPQAPLLSSSFSSNGYEMALSTRFLFNISPTLIVIPYVRGEYFKYHPELSYSPIIYLSVPYPNEYWKKKVEFGCGALHHFSKGLVSGGISFQYISLTNDATTKNGNLPQLTHYSRSFLNFPTFQAGVEYALTPWLTGRTGFFKRLTCQTTHTDPPPPLNPTESSTTVELPFIPAYGLSAQEQTLSLGLGISLGNVSINTYVAEQVIGSGTYLLSGIQQSIFGIVSLSYKL